MPKVSCFEPLLQPFFTGLSPGEFPKSKCISPKHEGFWQRKLNLALNVSHLLFLLNFAAVYFNLAVYLITSLSFSRCESSHHLKMKRAIKMLNHSCSCQALQWNWFLTCHLSVLVLHNLFNESSIIKLSSELRSRIYIISIEELKVRMTLEIECF